MIFGLIISSLVKCQEDDQIIKDNVCIKGNNMNYYFDNILIYFKEVYFTELRNIEIILITPFYLIVNFLEFACEIMIIYYLNPIYVLIKDNIYYFLIRMVVYFSSSSLNLTRFIIL